MQSKLFLERLKFIETLIRTPDIESVLRKEKCTLPNMILFFINDGSMDYLQFYVTFNYMYYSHIRTM